MAGHAPTNCSVTYNQNIIWRTDLPSTRQGTVIIKNDKVFVMFHSPIMQDEKRGGNTLGQRFNGNTGELLWSQEIQASK